MIGQRKTVAVMVLSALCLLVFSSLVFGAGNDGGGQRDESYQIGKGDVLDISVWKEQDLTRTVTVRTDGKISLPLIDDIQAAGRHPIEVKKTIADKLREYIEAPTVTVIVQTQASKRFYIIGEVVNTGEYPLTKDLTVVQAIALAGGFTEWADKDDIVLLRRNPDGQQRINIDYGEIVSGKSSGQNVVLEADDTVIIR